MIHLLGHDGLGELAHYRQLIAKIAIEGFKVFGQKDGGQAVFVGDHIAVVNVHLVGRFDEGVVEILVRRIERVVDLEGATTFAEAAADRNIPAEVCIAIYVQRVLGGRCVPRKILVKINFGTDRCSRSPDSKIGLGT
jgi:hypothetical protein